MKTIKMERPTAYSSLIKGTTDYNRSGNYMDKNYTHVHIQWHRPSGEWTGKVCEAKRGTEKTTFRINSQCLGRVVHNIKNKLDGKVVLDINNQDIEDMERTYFRRY